MFHCNICTFLSILHRSPKTYALHFLKLSISSPFFLLARWQVRILLNSSRSRRSYATPSRCWMVLCSRAPPWQSRSRPSSSPMPGSPSSLANWTLVTISCRTSSALSFSLSVSASTTFVRIFLRLAGVSGISLYPTCDIKLHKLETKYTECTPQFACCRGPLSPLRGR